MKRRDRSIPKPPRAGSRSAQAARIAPFIRRIYDRHHHPEKIGLDPLARARAFDDPADREVAAFLASALAYGNVAQINRSLGDLFGRLGGSPAGFAADFKPRKSDRALDGFYHRFNKGPDIAALFHLIGQMLRGWGSIEGFWAAAQEENSDGSAAKEDIADRAGRFVARALQLDPGPYADVIGSPPKLPFIYLLPKAEGPSACKRLQLFLRWVVRPDDGIDLGLWTVEKPSDLQFPVDTHILRLARYLGATRRKDAGARTRREITDFFRLIDPDDPVRFDFSLCRLGILGECPPRRKPELCEACELKPVCLSYARRTPAPIHQTEPVPSAP